ncbi:DUF1840 domain-containing protein [Undibacterium sp. RTI2.1]|uniref:DUF1840 domain-containing protein n=1 Tax=unclassified Undibacterium TaxID=2630295 RepID=UPI002AB367EB|nr:MULTISPECIES: DUF1840 domain-containing protein [unclassified Undibacterium]MDY7539413.1 DUF1840 domain-containing protein [Undibacterium sp. 5I1]MEB0029669.1 DUF1840 domain-containing protein [Undibacterium sp. RTI2.1]MEB0116140.1 DUF1840 domain-containing protein [Undibacterium sp. RTI2.2]MEB0231360.1 DUF1840 domain-containing protein [Undibacterium sp. 10I3]MEB0258360.1 DUF1840 domain-containing protein [Undibacterium sp. 5I1]
MLITFKSKAATEVTMYKEHARRILDMLNKNVDQGIITAAETAHAIQVIEAAVADSKAHSVSEELQRDIDAHHHDDQHDNEHEKTETVSFSSRAYPLLEMLHAAHKMQREVMWGV